MQKNAEKSRLFRIPLRKSQSPGLYKAHLSCHWIPILKLQYIVFKLLKSVQPVFYH